MNFTKVLGIGSLTVPSNYLVTADSFSSKVYLAIKKLHLQLLVVSNNRGAVHNRALF